MQKMWIVCHYGHYTGYNKFAQCGSKVQRRNQVLSHLNFPITLNQDDRNCLESREGSLLLIGKHWRIKTERQTSVALETVQPSYVRSCSQALLITKNCDGGIEYCTVEIKKIYDG